MKDALYAKREFGKYSTEWDEVMNAELEVVRHAYFESIWAEFMYSVKLPNSMTNLKMISTFDGDQPSYQSEDRFVAILFHLGIHPMDYRTIADYPRHGDTLRFGFRTLKDANAFLKDVLYRKALAETSYDRQAAQYYKDHPDATRSDF